MKHGCWLVMALLVSPIAYAQQIDKVQPVAAVRDTILSKPLGIAREVAATSRDFVMFRDPQWSVLTIAQIGAASADAVTSLNNLHSCPSCWENGVSRFFVGQHPGAHKYIIGGAIEIGVEAVTVHYFRSRGPARKWYWKALWTLPQSFSLYEHIQATRHNTALDLNCFSAAPTCN
jgi:hypothetical protein